MANDSNAGGMDEAGMMRRGDGRPYVAPDGLFDARLEKFEAFAAQIASVLKRYEAAMREMVVRFEILDASLEDENARNPIHHIESRMKKPRSIYEKLIRYEKPVTLESMVDNIFDIAGVRVIVPYLDDVYRLLSMLQLQDDLSIIRLKDYIK
ncbi:MAG: GTP pyrophosphokinase family protein, partial [Coriobacteriales bacterium]